MSKAGNEDNEPDHHPYRRPVDAATLILVDRSGAIPKVLVGKRHDKVVFQPGKIVFPGGRVDHTDGRLFVKSPRSWSFFGGSQAVVVTPRTEISPAARSSRSLA